VHAGLFILLAAAAAPDGPMGVTVQTATVAERVPLPRARGPLKLIVDSLSARLQVVAPRDRAAVASRIAAHANWICPKIVDRPDGVELRCRTRHLDAVISVENGASYLDIRELRGLPWRDGADGPPIFFYDPPQTGLGDRCPGNSMAGIGECLLRGGPTLEAARRFRAALRTPNRQLAALRLGDIALATGDPSTALGWYRRTGTMGVFGRVARTRECEIDGSCLGSTEALLKIFDPAGLPPPVRTEMLLRAVRAELYQDRFNSALKLLTDRISDVGYGELCRDEIDRLCRRFLLEIIRNQALPATAPAAPPTDKGASHEVVAGKRDDAADEAARAQAQEILELYLALPNWDRGPLAVELADASAELSRRLGAPVFGGNILSAVAPMVPPAAMLDHLARAAELYLEGGDEFRAKLLVEYATSTASQKASQTPRWQAIHRALAAAADDDAVLTGKNAVDVEAVAREAAAALALSKRARDLMKTMETAAGGQGGQP